MTIHARILIVIITTAVVIIVSGLAVGTKFLTDHISAAIEKDMMVVIDIADRYVAHEIVLLKVRAAEAAKDANLAYKAGGDTSRVLARVGASYPRFIGLAVFDATRLLDSWGASPVPPDLCREPFMRTAMNGGQAMSSTMHSPDGTLVMYVSAPMGDGRVLAAILPGGYFSELLSRFTIYQTGHLFIDDEQGHVIANIRPDWVRNRANFFEMAKTDSAYAELGAMVARGMAGERGTARFSVNGEDRVCSFRPLDSPHERWFVGAVAPVAESPLKEIPAGIFLVGVITLLLSMVAALLAARLLKRPYEEMERLREAAVVASRAKSKFLATMSHEIRTPMNAILGVAAIQMQDATLDSVRKEAFHRIHNSGDLLLGIINDILDMSKIEAGILELLPDSYEVASLIHDTVQLNMMRIGDKPIVFELEVDENTPSIVVGDALRVKQILNNLLSNAFKYTAKGVVRLCVSCERPGGDDRPPLPAENAGQQEADVTLVFRVSDTGPGMTAEHVSRLFDEYTRFHQRANRQTEGTGLGMSITRDLVRMMHGELSVESEPGRGSTFTVRLPQHNTGTGVLGRELAENLRQLRMDSRERMQGARIAREPMPYGSVLVVDDLETNLHVAKGLLLPYGLSVDLAESGVAALEKVRQGKVYDIIFMDHMMPDMDGMETTQTLRDRGYTRPIVALTANAVRGQAELFRERGFDEFISKPVDIRHLNAILNKFVRDRHPPEVVATARREQLALAHGLAANGARQYVSVPPQLVKSFLRDASRAIAALEAFCAHQDAYTDEDLRNYVVTVHGIKSALANIGAADLSALAFTLEQAGLEANVSAVSTGTLTLLDALRELTATCAPKNDDADNEEMADADRAYLCERLLAIKAACAAYNKKAAKSALAELQQRAWPQSISELLETVDACLLHSKFKNIIRIVDAMTEE